MKSFPLDKYSYNVSENVVTATSTYGGKEVSAVAKCDPKDEFDIDKGKELAALRCNTKIATKRLQRANHKLNEAETEFIKAYKKWVKMLHYYEDSKEALNEAAAEKEAFEYILG